MKKLVFIMAHEERYWRELVEILTENSSVVPIVLQEQPDEGSPTIIDKFEKYASRCCYAFAILTPDDLIRNDGHSERRARPNIIFELGWFVRHLGRKRIMMLVREGTDLDAFSDFQGVLYKQFRDHISEVFRDIAKEMKCAGLVQMK